MTFFLNCSNRSPRRSSNQGDGDKDTSFNSQGCAYKGLTFDHLEKFWMPITCENNSQGSSTGVISGECIAGNFISFIDSCISGTDALPSFDPGDFEPGGDNGGGANTATPNIPATSTALPVISLQPRPNFLFEGEKGIFTVGYKPEKGMAVTWYFKLDDGASPTLIVDANSKTLIYPHVNGSNGGIYFARVTNAKGEYVESDETTLTVLEKLTQAKVNLQTSWTGACGTNEISSLLSSSEGGWSPTYNAGGIITSSWNGTPWTCLKAKIFSSLWHTQLQLKFKSYWGASCLAEAGSTTETPKVADRTHKDVWSDFSEPICSGAPNTDGDRAGLQVAIRVLKTNVNSEYVINTTTCRVKLQTFGLQESGCETEVESGKSPTAGGYGGWSGMIKTTKISGADPKISGQGGEEQIWRCLKVKISCESR